MNRKPFDLKAAQAGEPIVTRSGEKCEFVAYNPGAPDNCKVIVFLPSTRSYLMASTYGVFGRTESSFPSEYDLFMARESRVWINFYPGIRCGEAYPSRDAADAAADRAAPQSHRIACVEVVFTEGQGL